MLKDCEINATHVSNNRLMKWLLFLPQLPAASSTARVALWRQLRACGATKALQGAWVLPGAVEGRDAFERLADSTLKSGGTAAVFECEAVHGISDEELVARFRADRAREYQEFATKVADFFAEVDKEIRLSKFDFAELEEIEDDLGRLASWFEKIRSRDHFPDQQLDEAASLLRQCEAACGAFADRVYQSEDAENPQLTTDTDDASAR